MPICEADPRRFRDFDAVPCPDHVRIPTEEADAWQWNLKYRGVHDKLDIVLSQALPAGPHGVMPGQFPVFSKPIASLRGMDMGSRVIETEADCGLGHAPGHFGLPLLNGRHMSSDIDDIRALPRVSSVQVTYHEKRAPEAHAMPPGGFRLAIVDCFDFASCDWARERLRHAFLGDAPAVIPS